MTKVINILGAPGTGKSTYAAKLFAEMKAEGFSCELVQEFAKEIVYADNEKLRNDQLIVIGEQYRRTFVLDGKIDYIITDSPILLGVIYNKLTTNPYPSQHFDLVCKNAFERFENLNILLTHQPNRIYQQSGRVEDFEKSLDIQKQIISLIEENHLKCAVNPSVEHVVSALKKKEQKKESKNEIEK